MATTTYPNRCNAHMMESNNGNCGYCGRPASDPMGKPRVEKEVCDGCMEETEKRYASGDALMYCANCFGTGLWDKLQDVITQYHQLTEGMTDEEANSLATQLQDTLTENL